MLRKFLTPLIILLLTTGGLRAAPMFDIMVLFDGSGSITPSDYEDQRSAGQHLLNSLTISPTDNQFGIVQFGTNVILESGLSGNGANLATALSNMFQLGGQTNHADAFTTAHNELTLNARSGVQSVVILLTDGTPNEPSGGNPVIDAINAANALKNDGVLIYGIGVGGQVDVSDIEFYTSGPTANTAFHVDNFSDATTAINSIVSDLNAMSPPPAVSEPGPLAVMVFGLGTLVMIRRRRANTFPV